MASQWTTLTAVTLLICYRLVTGSDSINLLQTRGGRLDAGDVWSRDDCDRSDSATATSRQWGLRDKHTAPEINALLRYFISILLETCTDQ